MDCSQVVDADSALDQTERTRLVRLERTVDRAVEVAGKIAGDALATIRDERLYRITHTTFDSYVEERWGFSRATAYRMIDAATDPGPRREVEGSSHRETNPQPTREREEDEPSPSAADESGPMPPDAARTWADVEVIDPFAPGRVVLRANPLADLPPSGARVLLAWMR